MPIAASFAPPWSGPLRAPIAATTAAARSAPVHLVLGMQDHRHVEGAGLALGRPLAVQHGQEALGVGEGGIRRHGLETLAAPVVTGDDRG
jgi:hypothetical protein